MSHLISSLLFGVTPFDPLTYAMPAGLIAAAAMDQRGSLKKALGANAGDRELEEFKTSVAEILTPHASAILLDDQGGCQDRALISAKPLPAVQAFAPAANAAMGVMRRVEHL